MTAQPTATQGGELPKQYRPTDHESRIRTRWDEVGAFHADPSRVLSGEAKPYCIVIPPPNVTAALHLGHALNNTLQDVLIRAHRMMGFETLWMPGTDHAGIATQAVVEKRVQKEEKKRRTDFTREAFVAKIQAFKDEYEATITNQLKVMGCSCDWPRQRFTMDETCARAVREAFFRLFKDGLIYRGKRLVNWDPALQTAVADDECYDEEIDAAFYYLRYPLVHPHGASTQKERKQGILPPGDAVPVTWSELEARGFPGAEAHPDEEQAYVTVATTRPETYLGDTAVAVNPNDPRAKALRGLCVELPLVGRVIPIVEDAYVVLPSRESAWGKGVNLPLLEDGETEDPKAAFATGFLKVTPAHDQNDYELYQRHKEVMDTFQSGPGNALINVMAPDASISDKHGWNDVRGAHIFVGKKRDVARKLVIDEFKVRTPAGSAMPLLADIKPYRHSVKHSDRSKAIIEPYLSDQWYVKVTDPRLAAAANRALGGTGLQTGDSTPPSSLQTSTDSSIHRTPLQTSPSRILIDSNIRRPLRPSGFVGRNPYPSGEPSPSNLIASIRNLPHLELPGATYFVTWTLLEGELSPVERTAVLESILHGQGKQQQVYAACVMPDHVHCLVRPLNQSGLGEWTASVKKFTSRRIHAARGAGGQLWQDERFDHIVRDEKWLGEFAWYISRNPVDAGLVAKPSEYEWTFVDGDLLLAIGGEGAAGGSTALESGATKATASGDGSMRFYPARYAKTFEHWHDNIRDWCISRQLWWGHQIPVWRPTTETRSWRGWEAGSLHPDIADFQKGLSSAFENNRAWSRKDAVLSSSREPANQETLLHYGGPGAETTLEVCIRDPEGEDSELVKLLESAGFVRDLDVLDTWFSSALWPMSTMGWPDPALAAKETGITDFPHLLAAFNPTSTLCTAREIITLWVSRMTMFNRYFMPEGWPSSVQSSLPTAPGLGRGPVPFKDVFIHAVIQDGEGRKMSKSLGNGVDPLDVIATHGADAMRFTLCHMATNTQDVRLPVVKDPASGRNTSTKFDLGRNFSNKLWNAARFAIGILSAGGSDTHASGPLSLPDRWMLSRLQAGVAACNAALAEYQFADYAQTVYDLLWRDFCDWYLEAIKPTVANDARQRAVLKAALDTIVRLLHPVCPFVTEAIYEKLSTLPAEDVAGVRLTPARKGGMLCTAGWPEVDQSLADERSEAEFERLRSLVTAIREVRAQQQVNSKRRIILHGPAKIVETLAPANGMVWVLGGLERVETAAPTGPAVAFRVDGQELQLSSLADAVDDNAERARLEKLIAQLEKSIATMNGRLSSPGYVNSAPPAMVQQTRDQKAKAESEREAALQALARLKP